MPFAQSVESNCGRIEARAVECFDVTSEHICFPHARKAARLTQATDFLDNRPPRKNYTVFLLSSNPSLSPEELLQSKRTYWSIENGPHQMLDNSRLQEDKSRIRNRTSVLNMGMFRRLAVSLGTHWIRRQPNPRKATLNGFFDEMGCRGSVTAFRMALCKKPTWLP